MNEWHFIESFSVCITESLNLYDLNTDSFFLFPLYVQIQPLSYLSQWKTLLLITEHCINTNMRTHAQTHRRSHFLFKGKLIYIPTRQQKTRLNMSLQKFTMQSSLTFEQWISVTFLVICFLVSWYSQLAISTWGNCLFRGHFTFIRILVFYFSLFELQITDIATIASIVNY